MRKRIREIVVVVVVVVVKTFHIDFCLSTLKEKKVRCENLFGCTRGSPVSHFNRSVQLLASCCCCCCYCCRYCCCCYRCCGWEEQSIPRALSIMAQLNTCLKCHTCRSSQLEEHTVPLALVQPAVVMVPVLPLLPRYNRERR